MSDFPKVKCKLVDREGNAFAILGRFETAARKAGWTEEQIKTVMDDAMSGDYIRLVDVIARHCVNGGS